MTDQTTTAQETTRQFRKKPVVIEARQLGNDYDEDWEILRWANGRAVGEEEGYGPDALAVIPTLEGQHVANRGDWIIRGVKGEFYPCKPDIFAATYEAVRPSPAPGGDEGTPTTDEQVDNLTRRLALFLNVEREAAQGASVMVNVTMLRDAYALVRRLTTALAERREDGERLDWWQAQRTHTLAPVMDTEGWRLHEADHLSPLPVPFARTLREAIDAARHPRPEGADHA